MLILYCDINNFSIEYRVKLKAVIYSSAGNMAAHMAGHMAGHMACQRSRDQLHNILC